MAQNNARYYSTGFMPAPIMDTRTGRGGTNPMASIFPNFQDVGSLISYLQTQNPSYWTADRIAKSLPSDLVFAARQINGGIR